MAPKLIRNARECERILDRNDCPYRNASGSHRVATLPDGEKLVYPDHGEWGKGLARKITKVLVAAGLLGLVSCMIFSYFALAH